MKTLLLITFFLTFSFRNYSQQNVAEIKHNEFQGFLFVNVAALYHHSGYISILDTKQDTILSIENKFISINEKKYEAIEEEYLYRDYVDIEVLEYEYGLFILNCYGELNGYYKVELNNSIGLIHIDSFKDFLEFKSFEKYIMETSPIPTAQNPLMQKPNENSEIVRDFEKWTYLSVEIKGDWLRVTDDKECYKGSSPSPVEIVGWIRWRKDGKFILKVAHTC